MARPFQIRLRLTASALLLATGRRAARSRSIQLLMRAATFPVQALLLEAEPDRSAAPDVRAAEHPFSNLGPVRWTLIELA
jgi:hypothetical protein